MTAQRQPGRGLGSEDGQMWASGSTADATSVNAMAAVDTESGEHVIVSVSDDPVAQVWSPSSARGIEPLPGLGGPGLAVACTIIDGRRVAITGGADGRVLVHDLLSGQVQARVLATDDGPVQAVACADTDSGIVVFSASGYRMRACDLASGRELASFEFPYEVTALCACPPGVVVAAVGHEVVAMTWSGSAEVPVEEEEVP